MRFFCITMLILVFTPNLIAKDTAKYSLILKELDNCIENQKDYIAIKERKIDSLKNILRNTPVENTEQRYDLYLSIFDEYKSYKYDSAYVYTNKGILLSVETNNKNKLVQFKQNLAFCYLSSGLFKESYDVINSINTKTLPKELLAKQYILLARLYSDMSNYNDTEPLHSEYVEKGIQYCDSVSGLLDEGSINYLYIIGLKSMLQNNYTTSIEAFAAMINRADISMHSYAIASSCMGFMYSTMGNMEDAIYYMSSAAIADIKSGTKETVALCNLASFLYRTGDISRANSYVRIAMEDANTYNARHRKIEISLILPIIEKERFDTVEKQRNELVIFLSAITLLFILLLISTIVIYKQMKRLHRAKRTIQYQNKELKQINNKLQETSDIKDLYIAQSLYGNSEYIDKIDKLYKMIARKLTTRQYSDIQSFLDNSKQDLKRERENMYFAFDQTFLKLFPSFIDEYNKLFKEEDITPIEVNKGLAPEIRIFALIRLGIHENERIARFLDYSVNTINTYKTKVKNKSIVPNEIFEQKIMEIKSVRVKE